MEKRYTRKQIAEAIGYWQKMLEGMERSFTPDEVHVITDKGVLNSIRDEIFRIVQDSYAGIGGFHGASSPRTLIKDTDLAKIVFGEDGKVTALALYRTDLDGNKRFCSGTRKSDSAYREAAEAIVRSDIEPYDGWYWVEASGAIEKLFKKNGGNPIPNRVAVRQIGAKGKDASLMDDGVHYETYYGQDRTPEVKMMFGFKSQDVYDRVMSEIDDYGKFKAFALSLAEGGVGKNVAAERAFISDLFDMHREGVVNELTPKWRDRLESAKSIIEDYMAQGGLSAAETASLRGSVSRAETCLEEMPVLKLGKIVA